MLALAAAALVIAGTLISKDADDRTTQLEQSPAIIVSDPAAALWVVTRPIPRAFPERSPEALHGFARAATARGIVRNAAAVRDHALEPAQWADFRRGYLEHNGRGDWLEHFVNDVLPCESRGHGWADTYPLYVSKAQFHPDSWPRAARLAGLHNAADPADPRDVGALVAAWSNAIAHPGGSGGWPSCWWRGSVPPA